MSSLTKLDDTADKKLPFLLRTHPCPNCGNSAPHRHFRTRMFTQGQVESDGHVHSFTWTDPKFLQVHPPLYFLYFCTRCYFTAPAEDYMQPQEVLYGRAAHRENR